MSPGAHHDTLDDHTAAWNIQKITRFGLFSLLVIFFIIIFIVIGQSLASQFTWAIRMQARQIALFHKFSA